MDEQKKKKPIYKKWWFWILVVFLLMVIASAGAPPAPKVDTTKTTPAAQATEQTKKEEAIIITASELNAAYKKNEVSADNTYKGKLIDITGTIESIGKDVFDNPFVALKTSTPYITVQCMLAKEAIPQAGELTPGSKITLEGRGNGYLIYAMMKGCTISSK